MPVHVGQCKNQKNIIEQRHPEKMNQQQTENKTKHPITNNDSPKNKQNRKQQQQTQKQQQKQEQQLGNKKQKAKRTQWFFFVDVCVSLPSFFVFVWPMPVHVGQCKNQKK